MNNRLSVEFLEPLENAVAEFFPGLNPDVPQERVRHLTKECLDDIEP